MLVGDGANPGPLSAAMAHYRSTESAVRKLRMEIRLLALQSPEELEGLFSRMADWRPEVLSVFSASWFVTHRASLLDWVARMRLPAINSNVTHVEHGALIAYSDDVVHRHREVAGYVAKILSGVKPPDLPVQQPTKFELAINLKTAKALGITIPQSILLRADKVAQ
jgi:putative ABC transport system substrate-binding protein